ncbi:MAG: excinuclease ABC subunit UvrC [Thermoplasmata archaeon]|nr:excinuclease ABC subunit UvrC [Thermoplasmata archaeon]
MTDPVPALPGFVPASQLGAAAGDGFRRGPNVAGVYLFRSARGEVVYVGKARSLRHRVLDHLNARIEKDGTILADSATVEFVPTTTEREALLLEANLIKQYQPRHNALLKDDRSFPYLAVTEDETFPRILLVRRPRKGSASTLVGPYTSAREARSVARLLSEAFQLRRCIRLPKRACLYYYLNTCSAPCIGAIGAAAYRARTDQALQMLRGHGASVRPALEKEMHEAAERREFERAALLRDTMAGFAALKQPQHVVGRGRGRVDVVALAFPTDASTLRVAVGLLRVEDGEVRRTEPHLLAIPADDLPDAGELLRQFLVQYYAPLIDRPERIYVHGARPPGIDETVDWLEGEQGIEVRFRPTGQAASWGRLAERLARAHVEQVVVRKPPREVLIALQNLLQLPTIPNRIEGVDISLFQGAEAVGSVVVFQGGVPDKDEYRRFRIRTVEGTNDFAMIAEVVRRRYFRRLSEQEILPDLLLIDGGRGQVAAAMASLTELGLADQIPVVGLAKREEELYLPDAAEPRTPNKNAPPMLLLRAVRDEAHRFAVTYHRTRRRIRLREEVDEVVARDRARASTSPPSPSARPAR